SSVVPVFASTSSRLRDNPNVARYTRRNSAGHHFLVVSSLSVNMLTITASPSCTIASSCQAFARTKPCAGALVSPTLSPNHGKQIGTPPRIAWPCSHCDCELTKSTSSPPSGFQEVTCAPCRYISPTAAGEVMRTWGDPAAFDDFGYVRY